MRFKTTAARAVSLSLLVSAFAAIAGCSMQTSRSERPDWSLNGPVKASAKTPAHAPAKAPTKTSYGDWNGPDAPKPLTYDSAR